MLGSPERRSRLRDGPRCRTCGDSGQSEFPPPVAGPSLVSSPGRPAPSCPPAPASSQGSPPALSTLETPKTRAGHARPCLQGHLALNSTLQSPALPKHALASWPQEGAWEGGRPTAGLVSQGREGPQLCPALSGPRAGQGGAGMSPGPLAAGHRPRGPQRCSPGLGSHKATKDPGPRPHVETPSSEARLQPQPSPNLSGGRFLFQEH